MIKKETLSFIVMSCLIALFSLFAPPFGSTHAAETFYSWERSFNTADLHPEITTTAICTFDNKLFTGHWDHSKVFMFDGIKWDYSGDNTPVVGSNPSVNDFCVYNDGSGDALFAAVNSGAYGGVGAIWKYNAADKHWNKLTQQPPAKTDSTNPYRIYNIASYNGNLYACTGNPTNINEPVIYAYTPQTGWTLSFTYPEGSNWAYSNQLVSYNDGTGEKLYATFYYDTVYPNNKGSVYVFNGASWSKVYEQEAASVNNLCKHSDKLFFSAGAMGIGMYDNLSWSIVKSLPYVTYGLCSWNNNLYAANGLRSSSSVWRILMNDGSDPSGEWPEILNFSYLNPVPQSMNKMKEYNGKLYLGLQFASYRSTMTYNTSAQIFEICQYDKDQYGIGPDTKVFTNPVGLVIQDPAQTSASFSVINASDGNMDWSASEDASWISSITPASGSLFGHQAQTLKLGINCSGLASGDIYNGRIKVVSGDTSRTFYMGAVIGTVDTSYYKARIVRNPSHFYTTLAGAYNAASSGDTIQCLPTTFNNTLYFNRPVNVTIEPGMYYFSVPQDATVISGDIEISEGEINLAEGELRVGL